MDYSSALPEQRSFIEHPREQPALLAAGPGTGKTWVLERRSEYLVEAGVASDDIAVLTLTRSLAQDLSKRIPHGSASTLHSFTLRHLNLLGDAWGRIVVSPWEQREIVRGDLALGYKIAFDTGCGMNSIDAFLKLLGASFRDNQEIPADLSATEMQLRQVFLQHRELFRYRLLDELAYDLVKLIEAGTQIQDPPSHLLVDEYQDLTAGELRLLQLIQERFGATVNAAGDDRQSIFGFREADSRALHRFPDVYGIASPDYLWRSNRCPRLICDLANRVASGLPPLPGLERPNLEPWPGRVDEGHISIASYASPKSEARGVVSQCLELVNGGSSRSDIIVIVASYYRPIFTGLQKAAAERGSDGLFANALEADADVPIEMRLAMTCARLLLKRDDQLAWRTLVWATPSLSHGRLRRILEADGPTYLARLRYMAKRDMVIARPLAAGTRVCNDFGESELVNLREVVTAAAEELGCSVSNDNLESLGDEPMHPRDVARRLLEQDKAISEEERGEGSAAIGVHTIFSAKGLQAPHVFLVNAVNESFAGRGNVASSLRQAYVGVTRASSSLYISGARFLRHTALEHQMGVSSTRPADFLVDHCHQLGVELQVIRPGS